MLIVLIQRGSELFCDFGGKCKVKNKNFECEFTVHLQEVLYIDVMNVF